MDKLLKVGDGYHMLNEGESQTTTVRDTVSFMALGLFEDIQELKKTETDVQKRIPQEIMALNSIINAAKFLYGKS